MRIRKLAKLHGYTFCNNNAVSNANSITPPTDSPAPFLQSHICHLNQSPWDVATFSPESPSSPFQVDGDDSHAASFVDSTGAVESDVASMNISVGGGDIIESNNNANDNNNNDRKTQPWRPGKGNRRHETGGESSNGGRRFPTTNSYDFYYYSGFGPRWGKRRGSRNEIGVMEAEFEDELSGGGGKEGIDSEQLDYVELDEEDDDDYNEDERESGVKMMSTTKKKRGRKPIKARSLKSLM